jgi:hypothetical protein
MPEGAPTPKRAGPDSKPAVVELVAELKFAMH